MPTTSRAVPTTGLASDAGPPRASRPRLASPTTAVVLGIVVVALVVVIFPLTYLTHDPQVGWVANAPWMTIGMVFAGVGVVVARQQPENRIGWLLIVAGAFLILASDVSAYLVLDYRVTGGGLPLGPVVVVWTAIDAVVPFLLFPLVILLFPDGRLPSPSWRWTLQAYLVLAGVGMGLAVAATTFAIVGHTIQIDQGGNLVTSSRPGTLGAVLNQLDNILFGVMVLFWLAWLVRIVVSLRHAVGDRRQQLKWLLGGASGTIVCAIILVTFSTTNASISSLGIVGSALGLLVALGLAALPVGLGVGVLKYRLYDVDRLISRTLSYAIVTGLLIGVYVGLVTLATRVLPFSSPLGVAASTLAAVALFTPLRRLVQRLVDRRFNRARYDADATVAAFAHRVRVDVDLEVVSSEFVRAVQASVEPAHVSLWLRPTESRS